VQAAERRLIERADVVITTSAALYESKRRLHPNTHLVRHGVDVAHFARALDDGLPEPADLAGIRRPILGFFGLIHHWIDCDLIVRVARQRPNLSFVLIGSNRSGHPGLTETPNIHLLGRREYARLPAYCKAFDAALLPFVCNRMTLNINPIKLREYLAAGLPVVSTPLPEAARYQPHVQIARDPDDFARACDAAITHSSPKERRQRARCVADETWEAVVEKLSRLVTDPSGRPAACAPAAALTG
jgi:glycosyltransferase involved in cell wall biosynthesis